LASFRWWAPVTGQLALAILLHGTFCASGWPEVLTLEKRLAHTFQPVPAESLGAWELQAGEDGDEMPAGEDPAALASDPEPLKVLHHRAGPAKRGRTPSVASPPRAPLVLAAAAAEPGPAFRGSMASPPHDPKVSARPPPAQIPPPPTLPVLPHAESAAPSAAPVTLAAGASAASPGEVPLVPGWNLVSLPVEPASVDPAAVLLPIAGRFDLVHAYDACATADPWRTYDPAAASGNTLTALDHRIGFWIRATAAVTLPVSGTAPAETTLQLCPGWNLIGYPLTQPRSVPNALHSIAGKYLRVYGYDPNDLADPWEVFDVGVPDWANDLQTMRPGRGYWVFATEATTLTLANTGPPPDVAIASPGTFVTAPTAVVGTVASDLLDHWTLAWRRIGETGFTTFATGNAPADNAALATFDPSLQVNGLYEIELTATDFEGRSTAVSTNVIVEGRLKVGNFTVSFTDLEVPVAGIPIQVIRTYDSRDRSNGDFGAGWTLSLNHARLQESDPPGDGWQGQRAGGTFANYCIAPLRPKTVTITLPDDTVYRFRPTVTPACQLFAPPAAVTLGYAPLPGTTATLTPIDQSGQTLVIGAFPGRVVLLDEDFTELADPNRYKLTLKDGRELVIDQTGGGLISIKDLNGNQLTFSRTGIGHSSGKTITFERDTQGRITKVIDPMGQAIEYGYSAAGDLIAVSDRMRQVSRFGYDNSHYLLTIEDPRGIQPIRNEYDDQGRLVRHTDAFGKIFEFVHDVDARREVVTDRLGHSRVLEFDARGNVIRQADARGKLTLRSFDAQDHLLSETDPLGDTITYTYDPSGKTSSVTDPLGNTTRYTYNTRGQILTISDPRGGVTTSEYDAAGNLLRVMDPIGSVTDYTYDVQGNPLTVIDAEGNRTTTEYDPAGNVIREIDALSHATTYTYDANGNRLTQTRTRTTPGGVETLAWRFTYDAAGQLQQTIDPDGTMTRVLYDPSGRISTTVDKLGREMRYTFDELGRLTRTTYPDGTSDQTTYDVEGRRTSITDREGHATQFEYDPIGHLAKTIFSDGTFTVNTYDDAGRLVAFVDAAGYTLTYTYNAAGQRIKQIDALGQVTEFGYDAIGNRTSLKDPKGATTVFEYDGLRRLIRTLFADGTEQVTTYDRLGQKTSETDPAGKRTQLSYDPAGRLITVRDATGGITHYGYDEIGNQVSQIDALGRLTRFEYDALGRQTKRILPAGELESMGYDPAGNLALRTDFNGRVIRYYYDINNRLVRRSYPDGSEVSFTYTPTGRRSSVTDDRGTAIYQYDARNRLRTLTYPEGRSLVFAYDSRGSRTSLQAVTGSQRFASTYVYDALNRLQTVTDSQGRSYALGYDPNGNRSTLSFPNGVEMGYDYDPLNRLTRLTVRQAAGVMIHSSTYTLGPAGNRTRIEEQDGTVRLYTYDDLYRLIREEVSGGPSPANSTSFTYDAVGNRLSRSRTGSSGTTTAVYGYDVRDRLLSETGAVYSWDSNGNLVNKSGVDGATYRWDMENRLVEVTKPDGTTIRHSYDADGNRIRTETRVPGGSSSTIIYLVDPSGPRSQIVAEVDESGAVSAFFVRGDDLLAVIRPSGSRFYHADGLGSIRLLTDESGTVTDSYTYSVTGELISHVGSDLNAYLFAGEPLEPGSGLYHLRTRWMDPGVGRFVSQDTYPGLEEDPRTLHKYLYALADPVNRTDPDGRIAQWLFAAIIGSRVHKMIGDDFVAGGPGRFANYIQISTILGINSATCKPSQVACRQRPDLTDTLAGSLFGYSFGEVYEIKPYTSFTLGFLQLADYITVLTINDPLHRAWVTGETYFPPFYLFVPDFGGWDVAVSPPILGVILYRASSRALSVSALVASFVVAAFLVLQGQLALTASLKFA